MLAIHGAVANAAAWLGLERELGAALPVDAPDLPGHGLRRAEPFVLEAVVSELSARAREVQASAGRGFPMSNRRAGGAGDGRPHANEGNCYCTSVTFPSTNVILRSL